MSGLLCMAACLPIAWCAALDMPVISLRGFKAQGFRDWNSLPALATSVTRISFVFPSFLFPQILKPLPEGQVNCCKSLEDPEKESFKGNPDCSQIVLKFQRFNFFKYLYLKRLIEMYITNKTGIPIGFLSCAKASQKWVYCLTAVQKLSQVCVHHLPYQSQQT